MIVQQQPGTAALRIDARRRVAELGPGSARVLVVDDNPIDRRVAVGLVESLGYDVCLADDGRDAVAAAATDHFDLILMDCQMPLIDGFAATASIRASEGDDRHTPIVALTASVLQQDRQRCIDTGMDDHLAKPVRRNELIEILTRFLRSDPALAVPPVSAGAEPPPDTVNSIAARLDEVFEGLGGDTGADRIELLESFLCRVALEVDQIDDAVAVDDRDALRARAHSVKGMAGNVGASHVARAAAVVEDAARDGHLEQVPHAAALLRRTVADVDEQIRGMLADLTATR